MVAPDDVLHTPKLSADQVIPPSYVTVVDRSTGQKKYIAQYAPTVYGTSIVYDPANDCSGYFMSYRFQPNNNCYAYGCNIASNSFPQPGRMNGYFMTSAPSGTQVAQYAQADGLAFVGTTIDEIRAHETAAAAAAGSGHYVALLISPADSANGWPGDYHWVRCDDNVDFSSWSQKDGGDQVTNFDFAGNPITDAASANWTVNQGPESTSNPADVVVSYDFYGYMYVPPSGVVII
jgi:hypothetical protein